MNGNPDRLTGDGESEWQTGADESDFHVVGEIGSRGSLFRIVELARQNLSKTLLRGSKPEAVPRPIPHSAVVIANPFSLHARNRKDIGKTVANPEHTIQSINLNSRAHYVDNIYLTFPEIPQV